MCLSSLALSSPETVLHDEGAEGKEETDDKGNTNIGGVLGEGAFDTINTVLAWGSS